MAGVLCSHAVVAQRPARAMPESAAASSAGPRILTPADRREGGAMPSDLRPEGAAVPQLRLPIGRSAPVAEGASAPSGAGDSVARCESRESKAARSACLRRLRAVKKSP